MKLRELRISLRITQEDLTVLSGVSIRTIRNVESGSHPPSVETMLKVTKALGVGLADIDEFKQRIAV